MPDNARMSPDVLRLLQSNFPAIGWSEAQLERLEALLRVRRLAAGATLFSLGESTPAFYGVLSGGVETRFSTAAGQVSVVTQIEPGRLFGLAAFVTGRPATYEAVAVAPTRVLAIGPAAYAGLMDDVPGFARALMREFALRFDETMHLLEAARHRGAEERLCLALHQLREEGRAGAPSPAGPWAMQVTQGELAARANVSRQTANEWLARWAERGWVERRYRGLTIARWPRAADPGT
jgi:CRP/FNR family cyclic AMP-dependent transcriptional regulator